MPGVSCLAAPVAVGSRPTGAGKPVGPGAIACAGPHRIVMCEVTGVLCYLRTATFSDFRSDPSAV